MRINTLIDQINDLTRKLEQINELASEAYDHAWYDREAIEYFEKIKELSKLE